MRDGAKLALAVGVGYYLGRKRRMRLAVALLAVGAAGRLAPSPGDLRTQGAKLTGASAELSALTSAIRARLLLVGRGAVAAASNAVEDLTVRIQERTEGLSAGEQAEDEESDESAEESGEESAEGSQHARSGTAGTGDGEAERDDADADADVDRSEEGAAGRTRRPGRRPVRRLADGRTSVDEADSDSESPRPAARRSVRSRRVSRRSSAELAGR